MDLRNILRNYLYATIDYFNIYEAVNKWFIDVTGSFNRYGHISYWDTSNVTDMRLLFSDCCFIQYSIEEMVAQSMPVDTVAISLGIRHFDQCLLAWDVSNVTDMESMFEGAKSFNQPLHTWNTAKVTTMSEMFHEAKLFNQPLNHFDTSNVANMRAMFSNAQSFNQPLDRWDVSKVGNMDLMFYGAKAFNQSLKNWAIRENLLMEMAFDRVADGFDAVRDAPWYRGEERPFGKPVSGRLV